MTPAELCAEIDSLAINDFQPPLGSLVSAQDLWPSVTAEALPDQPMREVIRARFSSRFKYFDSRATYSSWVKQYLNVLMPPVLLADILIGCSIAVDLSTLRFVVTETGVVGTIVISRVNESYDEDPFARFKPLILDHFVPLIGSMDQAYRRAEPSSLEQCRQCLRGDAPSNRGRNGMVTAIGGSAETTRRARLERRTKSAQSIDPVRRPQGR